MYYFLYTSSEYNDPCKINNLCVVCWNTDEKFEPVYRIKVYDDYQFYCECNTFIHRSCLQKWYNRTNSCPICREFIVYQPITYFINKELQYLSRYRIFYKPKIVSILLNTIQFVSVIVFLNCLWSIVYNIPIR
jgi:hypothetical protein